MEKSDPKHQRIKLGCQEITQMKKYNKYEVYFNVSRKRYVVKHNLITEVYLMTVMETTTCFGLYWPSSGCLRNLRASYMHVRARGVEISTYA